MIRTVLYKLLNGWFILVRTTWLTIGIILLCYRTEEFLRNYVGFNYLGVNCLNRKTTDNIYYF